MDETAKKIRFREFLFNRNYTEKEINKAKSIETKNNMLKWNRLVLITRREFDKIFK